MRDNPNENLNNAIMILIKNQVHNYEGYGEQDNANNNLNKAIMII